MISQGNGFRYFVVSGGRAVQCLEFRRRGAPAEQEGYTERGCYQRWNGGAIDGTTPSGSYSDGYPVRNYCVDYRQKLRQVREYCGIGGLVPRRGAREVTAIRAL